MERWGVLGKFIGQRDISDHCPVWLVVDKEDWGPKPFKFNNEWFHKKDFLKFVEKEWAEIVVYGRGDYVLKEKLRLLKGGIKWWNINVFGKIDLEMEDGVREMNAYDDMGSDVEDMEEDKRKANKKFWLNLKIKENMFIQRVRIKWINGENVNSKYFSCGYEEELETQSYRLYSNINRVLSSVKEVKGAVFEHFEKKFKDDYNRPVLEGDLLIIIRTHTKISFLDRRDQFLCST
ncbi:uncharacterized protein LOC131657494 [Vicia villosa]|uniref:uncharacterized protein LOC131657494 n=1 Tax=Vicia villosa TaxID=3911 RepID=UPI00273AE046|nr:uncharacterized protein LOC131657494 [Vicia villosa]